MTAVSVEARPRRAAQAPQRVPWGQLRRGALVHIMAEGRYLGEGTVDGLSRDQSTLWVQFGGVEGRRMFHRSDNVAVGVRGARARPSL